MDFTEKNIKMCGKAEEIQEVWQISDGDLIADRRFGNLFNFGIYLGLIRESKTVWMHNILITVEGSGAILKQGVFNKSDYIWLPDQAQLQAMLLPLYESPQKLMIALGKEACYYSIHTDSIEIITLQIVMLKLYNKIWDDKDWI